MVDPYTYQEDDRISNPDAVRGFGGALRQIGKNIDHLTFGILGGAGALVTMGGNVLQSLDSMASGRFKRATKELGRGAVESGTMLLGSLLLPARWLAESASVLLSGKYLSTHAGEIFGSLVDGIDKPKQSFVAAPVMLPGMMPEMAMPAGANYMDPTMASQPPGFAQNKWTDMEASRRGMSGDEYRAMHARDGEMQQHMQELRSAEMATEAAR